MPASLACCTPAALESCAARSIVSVAGSCPSPATLALYALVHRSGSLQHPEVQRCIACWSGTWCPGIIIGVAGHQIGVPEPLFRSITDEEVNSLRQRFIGSQAERAAAAAAALAGASLGGKVQLNVSVPDCIAAQDFVHCCVSLMAQEAFTVLLG